MPLRDHAAWCFVVYPVSPDWWTAPAMVSPATADEMRARGWWVLCDPSEEREMDVLDAYRDDLSRWSRLTRRTRRSDE